MEWISVKDRLPEKDCSCLVVNENRGHKFYVAHYSKCFNEFDVYEIGAFFRLHDPITFYATHWIQIPKFA